MKVRTDDAGQLRDEGWLSKATDFISLSLNRMKLQDLSKITKES